MRALLPLLLAIALFPATASAVSFQEIVSLVKAGVSEPIILALIERDKSIFPIGPEQVLALKNEGVSEAIVIAMLRSGRQEEPPKPEPPPAPVERVETEPNVVVVGREPERPHGSARYDAAPVPYFVPYIVPYVVPVPLVHSGCITRTVPVPAATGQFFSTSARGQFFTDNNTAGRLGGVPLATQVVTDCAPRPAFPRGRHLHQ